MIFSPLQNLGRLLSQNLRILGFGQKRCPVCLEPFYPAKEQNFLQDAIELVCPACEKRLERQIFPRCRGCGLPLPESPEKDTSLHKVLCHECLKNPPLWHSIAFYGAYAGRIRDLVLALKYSGSLYLCKLFAELLIEASLCLPRPDLLVPVPLSVARLRERGFNQALEIGREISRITAIPFSSNTLKRIKNNLPQEGLNALQRRDNIKGVFHADKDVNNKSIWLIDDVMTTGSTLGECTQVLLEAGAKSVNLLFVARTLNE